MKKRLVAMLTVLTLVGGTLVGCGSTSTGEKKEEDVSTTQNEETSGKEEETTQRDKKPDEVVSTAYEKVDVDFSGTSAGFKLVENYGADRAYGLERGQVVLTSEDNDKLLTLNTIFNMLIRKYENAEPEEIDKLELWVLHSNDKTRATDIVSYKFIIAGEIFCENWGTEEYQNYLIDTYYLIDNREYEAEIKFLGAQDILNEEWGRVDYFVNAESIEGVNEDIAEYGGYTGEIANVVESEYPEVYKQLSKHLTDGYLFSEAYTVKCKVKLNWKYTGAEENPCKAVYTITEISEIIEPQ